MSDTAPINAGHGFHVLTKPIGPICNLDSSQVQPKKPSFSFCFSVASSFRQSGFMVLFDCVRLRRAPPRDKHVIRDSSSSNSTPHGPFPIRGGQGEAFVWSAWFAVSFASPHLGVFASLRLNHPFSLRRICSVMALTAASASGSFPAASSFGGTAQVTPGRHTSLSQSSHSLRP